jgi:uncharacterized damage-inducible protein DinB
MVTAEQMRLMARYSAWQNRQQTDAASRLSDEERRRDRGAFFGSIFATLNHLLWADRIWLSRFTDAPGPNVAGIQDSPSETADWQGYCEGRAATDAAIGSWVAGLSDGDLAGDLVWWSGAAGREMRRPRALLATHIFNHATHHRGQVHAMLTAAGVDPGVTDLPFLPEAQDA